MLYHSRIVFITVLFHFSHRDPEKGRSGSFLPGGGFLRGTLHAYCGYISCINHYM